MQSFFSMLVIASLAMHSSARAEDWPQFRHNGGVAPATSRPPTTWDSNTNIAWKAALPGPGASSPVTFGKHVYVTCYSGYGLSEEEPGHKDHLQRHLVCLRLTDGGVEWTATIPRGKENLGFNSFVTRHGYASSTPVVDESGIYVYYALAGLMAYDHKGKERWTADCGHLYMNFGSAASPILHKDTVIINASIESNAIIAFNKRDGKEVWRYKEEKTGSFCTPLIVKVNGVDELICFGKDKDLIGLDAATGKRLWTCTIPMGYNCPSFVARDGVVYAISDSPGCAVAVRLGGRGDVTATHRVWHVKRGSEVCSPVLFDGHLYWTKEESVKFFCVNAATGEVLYEERADPKIDLMYASPVLANGNLYYVSQRQGTFVVEAKPAFKLVAKNVIHDDDSVFNGSPAVSGNSLLLRSNKAIYCIGGK